MPKAAALLGILAVPVLIVFSACGDADQETDVQVTLSEWEVVPEPPSVPAGQVTFDAVNEGEEEHELVVIRTDFAPAELPTRDDGSVDTGADGLDVVGETDEIEPGDEDSRVFSLDPGAYVLICNIVHEEHGEQEAHYEMGMFAAFEVTEAD